MDKALTFKAEIDGHGVVAVTVEDDGQGGLNVDIASDESTGLDVGIGYGKFTKWNYAQAKNEEVLFAEMTEEQARGVGFSCLMDRIRESEDEGAFYSIFQDHHRDWTFYNGDDADAEAMLGFLDNLSKTIARARRQVPMQTDQVQWERDNPEKVKAIRERAEKEASEYAGNGQGPIPFPLPVREQEKAK